MHLIIRADGGSSIGYGHLIRTGALADRVLEADGQVTFVTRTPKATQEVCPSNVDIVTLESERDHPDFLDWLADNHLDMVLVDSYEIDTGQQQDIYDKVPRLALILDDSRFTIRADVFINGNVHASELEYDWIGTKPEWCLGTDYLLLRKSIRKLNREKPRFHERAERAIVLMGGSDIRATTSTVVRSFEDTDLRVEVIIGPGFQNQASIEQAVSETEADMEILEHPSDLPKRMFRADLAVSACGSTIYELLALGTPTIGIPQAANQEPIAKALADKEVIVPLNNIDRLSGKIDMLAQDDDLRRSLCQRGQSLVDGQGVHRVYHTLMGRQ